jgi:beta-fructofuranosidase
MTAALHPAPGGPSAKSPCSVSIALARGEVLHIWRKPATKGGESSQIFIRAGGVPVAILSGPPSDNFQLATFVAKSGGEHVATWDEADTLVSIAYAYAPETVFEEGIHLLHVPPSAKASDKRYRLHLAPPFGWMNDPNGAIEFGGRTHLFYQHYPHARRWDTMHWGHAVTDNLVDWTHLPVFLHPPAHMLAEADKAGGAFSGSAIERPEGGLRIFHTDRDDGRLPEREWQMMALSSDALTAGESTGLICERPPLPGFGRDMRDPYVFKGPDGAWKMLLGGADETAALVLLYETQAADAATGWRFAGVLHREPLVRPVPAECPCLIALDGEGEGLFALVFGLIGHRTLVNGRRNPSYALVGRFDGRRFEEIARRELDFIGDCYAFQSFRHGSGPVGIAWAANWADVRRDRDFVSAMTFPRKLTWRDGRLLSPPVDAVRFLRGDRLADSLAQLLAGIRLEDGLAEVAFSLVRPGAAFRLELDHEDCKIAVVSDGRELEFLFEPAPPRAPRNTLEADDVSHVAVFLDVGLIELSVNGGRWSGTKRIESDKPVAGVRLVVDPADLSGLELWRLRPRKGA